MISFKTWVLTHKKSAVISFLVVPLTLSLLLNFGLEYRVLFNMTNSLPHTLYLTHPLQAVLKRGDYVAFTHEASPHIIVKRIVGIEGDTIQHKNAGVQLNHLFFATKEKRSNGATLTPMKAHTIPKGMLFVVGDHPGSFDSRYEEFGLISMLKIKGHVWPVF
jgi:conjugal transfer pilin signal peptidase TrbI